jgi:hypothetical protein
VSADPAQLDRWRKAITAKPSWYNSLRFFRVYSAIVTVIAVAGGILALRTYLVDHARGAPTVFQVDNRTLVVFDDQHREIWHQTYNEALAVGEYTGDEGLHRAWFGDVDADGHTETLFLYHPASEATVTSYLFCYSDDGRLKWRFAPERVVSDATQSYTPPYILAAFAVADSPGGGKMIAVTSRHTSYHPTNVTLVDGHGRKLGEYWHTGHMDYVAFHDIDADGTPDILLAGVDNAHEQATLVVLDPRDMTGASFEGVESPSQIRGFPLGKEKAVVFFPRTCVNRKYERYNMARDITVTADGLVRVRVFERLDQDELVVYTLDRDLRCVRAVMSDKLVATHRRLEGEGALDHALSDEEVQTLRRDVRVVPHAHGAG